MWVGREDVNTARCGETSESEHHCTHDWRIHWGNLERQR